MPIWIDIVAWVSRLILVLLFGLSVWSLAIIWDRRQVLKKGATDLPESFQSHLKSHRSPAVIEAWSRAWISEQKSSLDRGMTVLASLGSNAPYIGLFGTVLGIIQAFGALSANASGNMNLVMFLIAEALIATAVGLFVAIPALLAFNGFSKKIKTITDQLERQKNLWLAQVESGAAVEHASR